MNRVAWMKLRIKNNLVLAEPHGWSMHHQAPKGDAKRVVLVMCIQKSKSTVYGAIIIIKNNNNKDNHFNTGWLCNSRHSKKSRILLQPLKHIIQYIDICWLKTLFNILCTRLLARYSSSFIPTDPTRAGGTGTAIAIPPFSELLLYIYSGCRL